jgi:hypothetical protein
MARERAKRSRLFIGLVDKSRLSGPSSLPVFTFAGDPRWFRIVRRFLFEKGAYFQCSTKPYLRPRSHEVRRKRARTEKNSPTFSAARSIGRRRKGSEMFGFCGPPKAKRTSAGARTGGGSGTGNQPSLCAGKTGGWLRMRVPYVEGVGGAGRMLTSRFLEMQLGLAPGSDVR